MLIIIQEFCCIVHIHLLPIMIPKLTPSKIVELSAKFEEIHVILYILCVIDGSYISIVAIPILISNLLVVINDFLFSLI